MVTIKGVLRRETVLGAVFGGMRGATGPGVPSGGTLGQVIVKQSVGEYHTAWQTPDKALVGLPNVDNTSDLNKPVSTAQQAALNALEAELEAADAAHAARVDNPHAVTKAQVGLGNADNTSDVNKPVSTAQQAALDLKANLESPTFTGTVSGITKAMVGLGNVDNTSDANKPVSTAQAVAIAVVQADVDAHEARTDNPHSVTKAQVGLGNADNTSDVAKPVSTAQQAALDLKANIDNPTFTGVVSGITKAMVGLGNVDNTSDVNKPVSTAQQAALDLKANIESPTFTGTVIGITKAMVGLGNVDNTSDANKPISTATQAALDLKANIESPTFTGTVSGITKAMVGLGNVDNTSDLAKPISTATQAALDTLETRVAEDEADLAAHAALVNNPHAVTKAQVGLGNVDNTSDVNKPVSTAQQAALDLKANIESPTFTGTVSGITKAMVGLGNVDNTSDANKPISTATQAALDLKATDADLDAHTANTSNPHAVTKAQVGLGNVDNTSDANKPVSTAQQAALDLKANAAVTVMERTVIDTATADWNTYTVPGVYRVAGADWSGASNPPNVGTVHTEGQLRVFTHGNSVVQVYTAHGADVETYTRVKNGASDWLAWNRILDNSNWATYITKASIGLGNVDNTSDANKPISTATQTALDTKVDEGAIVGSGLTVSGQYKVAGRYSAGAGAIQELTLGAGLAIDGSGNITVIGSAAYLGSWDASTNTPTLADGVGTLNTYYKVSVAGNTIIDGNGGWTVGDVIQFNGTTWDKFEGGSPDVVSVAGKTGVVTLVKGDVGLGNVDNTSDVNKPVSTAQQAALDLKANLSGAQFTGFVGISGGGDFNTTNSNGLGFFGAGPHLYKIGFDGVGSTVGYLRHNIVAGGNNNTWGHVFSTSLTGSPDTFTNTLFVGASGNVGVGTVAPTVKLDVAGAINSSSTIAANAGSGFYLGANLLALFNSNTTKLYGGSSGLTIFDNTGATARLTIDGAGAVGVAAGLTVGTGIANKLQIAGSTTGNPVVVDFTGTDAVVAGLLRVKGAGALTVNINSSNVALFGTGGMDVYGTLNATGNVAAVGSVTASYGQIISNTADTQFNIQSTASGGRSYTLGAAATASGNIPGSGFYIYDNTSSVVRMSIDSTGLLRSHGAFTSSGAITSGGTITTGGNIIVGAHAVYWEKSGTRSWTAYANQSSGAFHIGSGDGGGSIALDTPTVFTQAIVSSHAAGRNLVANRSGGGDTLAISAIGAGGGGVIEGLNNAQSDYTPINTFAEYLGFHVRTGVGATDQAVQFNNNGINIYDDRFLMIGPNTSWGQYLRLGGNGNTDTAYATVATTDGNLHIDAKLTKSIYIGYHVPGYTYFGSAGSTWIHGGSGGAAFAGQVGVGQAPSAGAGLWVSAASVLGGGSSGVLIQPVYAAASLTAGYSGVNSYVTISGAGTVPEVNSVLANGGNLTDGAVVSIFNGFNFPQGNIAGVTDLRAYSGAVVAGTNRWNLYMHGTAANHLTGNLLIGTTTNGNNAKLMSTTGVAGATGAQIQGVGGQLIIGYIGLNQNYFDADTNVFRTTAGDTVATFNPDSLQIGQTTKTSIQHLEVVTGSTSTALVTAHSSGDDLIRMVANGAATAYGGIPAGQTGFVTVNGPIHFAPQGVLRASIDGGGMSIAGAMYASGQVASGYGTFAAPAMQIGDAQYGMYAAGGALLLKSSSNGSYMFQNVAGTGTTLHVAPNVLQFTTDAAGAPNVSIAQVSNNPYLELQRWTGTGSNFYGQRIKNNVGEMTFELSNGAAIGSQTFNEQMRLTRAGLLSVGTTANPYSARIHTEVTTNSRAISVVASAADSDAGIGLTNDARQWSIAVRGGVSDQLVIRDVTNSIDAVKFDTTGTSLHGSLSVGVTNNANASLELGYTGGSATTPFIDFHTGATAVDYDFRIIASGGSGASGGGALQLVGASLFLSCNTSLGASAVFNANVGYISNSYGYASATEGIAAMSTGVRGMEAIGNVSGPNSSAAVITFHRSGHYAAYLGIDTDNQLKFGGWSAGANAWTIVHQGNLNTYLTWANIQSKPTTVAGYAISDAVTLSGAETVSNKTLNSTILNGKVWIGTTAMAALDIDCNAGTVQTKTINGSSTFTFSNPPTSGYDYTVKLVLTHTSGTVTWPASVKWPNNTAPTLTTGKVHIFWFTTVDGGTTWRATSLINYAS